MEADGRTEVLRDDYGRKVRIGRTQEGEPFISITDGVTSVMAVLSGDRLAAVTEALDRAAMPGQPGAQASQANELPRPEQG